MLIKSQLNQQQARQQQIDRNEVRRQSLLPVAGALRNPRLSGAVVKSALVQVRLWRSKNLCSRDYIEAWEALLKQPEQAAKVLEDQSPYAAQLRQNSPFVSTVRQFQSKHAA
jgi:hypothetical protein